MRIGDASDPGEVGRPVRLQLSYVDDLAGGWRVDDQPAAEVDAHVAGRGHGAVGAGDEHEVAGAQPGDVGYRGAGVELLLRGAGQADAAEVEALGGTLKISAVFDDEEVEIGVGSLAR